MKTSQVTIVNQKGQTVLATSVLCESGSFALDVLNSVKALTNKWWIKFVIGSVINAITDLIKEFCTKSKLS